MPSPHTFELAQFIFANQAEVDFALAQNWDGTFSRHDIAAHIEGGDIFRHRFTPFVWKIEMIRPLGALRVAPSKSPDTWLRKPYVPGVTEAPLP